MDEAISLIIEAESRESGREKIQQSSQAKLSRVEVDGKMFDFFQSTFVLLQL
jgi:hypothetical protein